MIHSQIVVVLSGGSDNLVMVGSGRQRSSQQRRGQVAVETALVMPLFVFCVLGLMQITLMHQARLMTKYAAYKAVRAGSIGRGSIEVMQRAALSVLVPVAGRGSSGDGVYQTRDSNGYSTGYSKLKTDIDNVVRVTICSPINGNTGDFDDPKNVKTDDSSQWTGDEFWKDFDSSKLAIQVTLYYRMSIPFVNGLLWYAINGQEAKANAVVRLGKSKEHVVLPGASNTGGRYVMPLRANYAMRMQSNFEKTPPSTNDCLIPWSKR